MKTIEQVVDYLTSVIEQVDEGADAGEGWSLGRRDLAEDLIVWIGEAQEGIHKDGFSGSQGRNST